MPVRHVSSRSHGTFRTILLTGVSAVTLLSTAPALAKGSLSIGVSPAMMAASGAMAASQQAAQVAAQAQSSLAAATRAIQAMQAAQSAARNLALAAPSTIPNGLVVGGLVPDSGLAATGVANPVTSWVGAHTPTQSSAGGQTTVDIQQTQPQALLNWQSFNVSKNTTVNFDQQGNSSWVALNKIAATGVPSQILGQIKAPGQVYLINPNGIIFGGSAQVNVNALVASSADLDPTQFLTSGIYSTQSGGVYAPSFANAGGPVTVEAGAQITTNTPGSVTEGGGFVLLMGTQVQNAGAIITPDGQTELAAGDNFLIRPGVGTNGNAWSTTRGNEIAVQLNTLGSSTSGGSGLVSNTGYIEADTGDITLAGETVTQGGVLLSTTSVNTRGTIHLLSSVSDPDSSVTLIPGSLTTIAPDTSGATALDSQRAALIADSATQDTNRINDASIQPGGQFDDLSMLADMEDESRVEIVTGGNAEFQGGSQILANAGQIAVSATARVQADAGAILDVSGLVNVLLPMSANDIAVEVQGNELRDDPNNRLTSDLFNSTLDIDARDLTLVPAGTGGDPTDRYYTAGGLLEVSGWLANIPHTIGEWMATGGNITLSAGSVVAQAGSSFNLSGGSIQYQSGMLPQSYVIATNGQIFNVNLAPADLTYTGAYNGFVVDHAHWGITEIYGDALHTPSEIFQPGYTVGRDAGSLILSTPTSLFEGDIEAGVIDGAGQTTARPSGVTDPYTLPQDTVPLQGSLELGQYNSQGLFGTYTTAVAFDAAPANAAGSVSVSDPIPTDLVGTANFDAGQISGTDLGGLSVATAGSIAVNAPLTLASGGKLTFIAPDIDIAATVTAHSGSVSITNLFQPAGSGGVPTVLVDADGLAQATLEAGATINTQGIWTNGLINSSDLAGLPFLNGGNVSFDMTQGVTLAQGSLIDTSSGAAILPSGNAQGGAGGNITLIADDPTGGDSTASLILGGTLRAYGVTKGGILTIETGQSIYIADQPILTSGVLPAGEAAPSPVVLISELDLPAGATAPFAVPQTFATDNAGQSFLVGVTPTYQDNGTGLLVQADWTVPTTVTVVDSNGTQYSSGQIVPAGTLLTSGTGKLPPGFVVPPSVFPNGIAINPVTVDVPQGSVLIQPVTLAAGSTAPAGAVFTQAVAIQPLLNLPTSTFSGGFSAYTITGQNGITVASGAQVNVTEPVYRFTDVSGTVPTGTDPNTALSVWTPPLYLQNPVTAELTQRAGASLTLDGVDTAKSTDGGGPVTIGSGALLAVDPGQSINLDSNQQITIDGRLRAPGGAISITGAGSQDNSAAGQSIWIGSDAMLDVSAQAATALDQLGRTYGVVPNGGSITLGAAGDVMDGAGIIESSYDFIVIRPGAVLDAAGASAFINPNAGVSTASLSGGRSSGSVLVASNGGAIVLSSYSGIYADGTLRAVAGGPGAAGGTLAVTLETPGDFGSSNDPGSFDLTAPAFTPRIITIGQSPLAPQLAVDLQPGTSDPSLSFGQAQFSADALEAGGFGALSFTARDAIVFDGDVNLAAGQSIAFHQGALADSNASGTVTITAPYVLLDGNTGIDTNVISVYPSLWSNNWQPSIQQSTGTFTVNASLIDISNQVAFGIDSPATTNTIGTQATYDFAGFADVDLISQGDIRFLPFVAGGATTETSLTTSGNLTFTAAQLYPVVSSSLLNGIVSPVQAKITAGAQAGGMIDPNSVISINRISAVDPDAPYTLLGSLTFSAGTINQGGVVRAPLGDLSFDAINQVNLLPGSITATSMNGLTMLFGGTADGVTWTYDGTALSNTISLEASFTSNVTPYNIVTLNGPAFNVAAGATVDVSGGGDIAGASFISGEGGSVNILTTPLINANPSSSYSAAGNQVYAIVPGYQSGYAPVDPAAGTAPGLGQQITIPAGVPGLPAGTYTLLPANYALLPGGYRVEVGGTATGASATHSAIQTSTGGFVVNGYQSVANTGVKSALPTQLIVMPGSAVRGNSDYNETDYSDYQIKIAASLESIRPTLPMDAGTLTLEFNGAPGDNQPPLVFDGTALFSPGTDAQSGMMGQPGGVNIFPEGSNMEIYAGAPTPGFSGLSLDVSDLNNIAAPSLTIGGGPNSSFSGDVTIDSGVVLKAAQVLLVSAPGGAITLQPGAEIDTIGMGAPPVNLSGNNIIDDAGGNAELVVSNGVVELNYASAFDLSGNLILPTITIGDGAKLYSQGSIGFGAGGAVTIADTAVFGTADLGFSAADINIGDPTTMASATVPAGFNLTQARLDQILAGDTAVGAPALQTLTLSASQSLNVFGSVDLDVIDPATGKADLNLVLNAPAIYGYGAAGDTATLTVGTLTWSGIPGGGNGQGGTNPPAGPGPIIANGPGTGSGIFNIVANQITFGFPNNTPPDNATLYNRVMYGFSTVNLIAPEITSNGRNTLAVYQAQGSDPSGPGTGGNLNLETSLLTGEAQSIMGFTAGSTLSVVPPTGAAPAAPATSALGAEIDLAGGGINVASTILLPSGKLTMAATGDLNLEAGADLDLAGQATTLVDQTEYSWGGTVSLQSVGGNITQAVGSTIDVSAVNDNAGSVDVQALGAGAGQVALDGTLLGSAALSSGVVGNPEGGSISVAAQTLGSGNAADLTTDFAALNTALTADGFSWSRSFDLKQGDLTIGDELQAHQVSVSVDNGSLTVNGTVNASGITPGKINLAAMNNLTLNGTLDAHGTALQVDSYGNPIVSENEGSVNLTTANGLLTLSSGSTIDVSVTSPQGVLLASNGDVELNAPRTGSGTPSATGANAPANATGDGVNVSAIGIIAVKGAANIAVNAFATYANAPADPSDTNGQIINQAYFDAINTDSQAFMNAADANPTLQSNLSGLIAYGSTFHVRPGIEIVSATSNGDVAIQGDLDLSGYRYSDPSGYGLQVNPGIYGSGEPGMLIVRSGNNLGIDGSVTDGFSPPPATPDDNGWVIVDGATLSQNTTVLAEVTLAAGTTFSSAGNPTLAYAIPIDATSVAANAVIPIALTTSSDITLPGSWTTTAQILLPGGQVIAKGTILAAGTVIPAGSSLAAGSKMPVSYGIPAMTIPPNTSLGFLGNVTLSGPATVEPGQVIPVGTTPATPPLPADGSGTLATPFVVVNPIMVTVLLPNSGTVNFPIPAFTQNTADFGTVIPVSFEIVATTTTTAAFTTSATTTITLPTGVVFPPNTLVPIGTKLRSATVSAGGFIPSGVAPNSTLTIQTEDDLPAGTDLSFFAGDVVVNATLNTGAVLPTGANVFGANFVGTTAQNTRPTLPNGTQGQIWAVAPLLPQGDLSWSQQFVAGADLGAADTQILQPKAALGQGGNIVLSDAHLGGGSADNLPSFSVIRTGTGSLALVAGGDFDEDSLYGIYTAGNGDPNNLARGQNADQSGTVLGAGNSGYEAAIQENSSGYFPAGGGDLLVSVQGDLNGDSGANSAGNWLWTQGGAIAGQSTAWWVNFGTFTFNPSTVQVSLTGFTGIGTLGGGNLTLDVGGNANGITAAIGSTGLVSNGALAETGGGILNADIGGVLNGGAFTDVRGNITIDAGAVGVIVPSYGADYGFSFSGLGFADPRSIGPLTSDGVSSISGGLTVNPGDGSVTVSARGDLVLADAGNPGLSSQLNTTPFTNDGVSYPGGGTSAFSLWTDATSINLFSAGGNLAPTQYTGSAESGGPGAGLYIYPSSLNAVAASGSIYFPASFTFSGQPALVELAPSSNGQLNLLAQGSIIGASIAMSGADPSVVPTPFNPAFFYRGSFDPTTTTVSNLNPNTYDEGESIDAFFAFGADTPTTNLHADDPNPIRIYAATGDIVGLDFGAIINWPTASSSGTASIVPSTWYIGAKSADIVAGRDIVLSPTPNVGGVDETYGFILNDNPTDVSLISAGGNIIYSGMQVAGPGQLVVSAGSNFYAGNQSSLTSLGPVFNVNSNDRSSGAGITLLAGVGADGPNYAVFANDYLNPADPSAFLASGMSDYGQIVQQDDAELVTWLRQHYGYSGDAAGAWTFFQTLSAQQQAVFLRQIFFEQLNQGGLQFNDPSSVHFKSYVTGRDAIATLFPSQGAQGNPIAYAGDITLFGPSGIHTVAGGDIQTFTPGGATTVGVEGATPPGTAGVITQGAGDIDMYSLASILLGESRIMTTFGGNIVAWSATGDINAGKGSKTTQVFTPPSRVYDAWGNVGLSPQTPSTGAGIATLAPIPEVPSGNINLVAPLGTVDAGEAGIRVSGNFNVAALRVVNAANITVQGSSTGIPLAVAPNLGALTTASNASGAAAAAAEAASHASNHATPQDLPSIITVEVIGYGGGDGTSQQEPQSSDHRHKNNVTQNETQSQDPSSPVQVIGGGRLSPDQQRKLTAMEIRNFNEP